MSGYAVMLNLTGKSCVVVGGGQVASRKITRLLDAGAQVTVISPQITDSIQSWYDSAQLKWLPESYNSTLLQELEPALIFATTDSVEINQQIVSDAHHLEIWVNAASDSTISDFHNMALVEKPPITIGISTNGSSPALLKHIKARIEQAIGDDLSTLAGWMGEIRSQAQGMLSNQSQRQTLYERILASSVLDLLRDGDVKAAREQFDALVNEAFAL